MMNKTKSHMPSAICTLATCLCLTYIPTAGWAFGEPDGQLNSYTEGADAVIAGILGQSELDPDTPFGNPNPADDIRLFIIEGVGVVCGVGRVVAG